MSALSLLGLALDAAAVAALWLIAARLTALPLAPPSHATTSTTEPPERNRTMSLSDNERRRHALAHIRRQVAAGRIDEKRWKKEFEGDEVGLRQLQEILDGVPAPKSSAKSTSTAKKE